MRVAETAYGVISPHFDDGVLSCGRLMAANPGALLVTVFSGGPSKVSPITPWDCLCQFNDGDDVTEARRAEDAAAAAVLAAGREDLGLWDEQYRYPRYGFTGGLDSVRAQGVEALRQLVEREAHRVWLAPVGWPHPDHRITSEIAMEVAQSTHDEWGLYSELPYRIEDGADIAGMHGAVFRGWQDTAREAGL
jgi:LmbE family N-acetylglucosaminyl deacetylase